MQPLLPSFSFRPRLAATCLLVALGFGCNRKDTPDVSLELGATRFDFAPDSAFAEYYELSGEPDQLRITLGSHETGCDDYRAPEEGEALVTITLRVAAGGTLAPGDYPWAGLGEDPRTPSEKDALPFVRLAGEGRLLDPGGGLTLTLFEKNAFGRVEGRFDFHGRGAEGRERSSGALRGEFRTRLCRISLDPGRAKTSSPK